MDIKPNPGSPDNPGDAPTDKRQNRNTFGYDCGVLECACCNARPSGKAWGFAR